MVRFTRSSILSVRNVIDRIDRRLSQIEPQMVLVYERNENRYKLYGAHSVPVTIELDELLGLWRFIGTRPKEYEERLIMKRGKVGRVPTKMYEEMPLSKRKHFHWISKLEACAREKLAKGVVQPAYLDYRGLLDDTKPEAPQAASDPPEPDFDFPDFDTAPSREPLEHHSV